MGLGIEDKLIKWDQIIVGKDEVKISEIETMLKC